MFDYRIKQMFFDRAAVTSRVDKATRRVLSKFGAFVRTRARSLIRKRKAISSFGQPPSSHTGMLRRGILFSYEPEKKTVVIGAARFASGPGDAPHALEHGGVSTRAPSAIARGAKHKTQLVRKRPFMQPALDAEKENSPELWKDAVKA
jgi:hypothetical protein